MNCPICNHKLEIINEIEYENNQYAIGDESDCLYCGQLIEVTYIECRNCDYSKIEESK